MQEQQVQVTEVKKKNKLHIASYILNVVLLITVAVLIVMLVKPEGGFSSILGGGVDMRERVGEPITDNKYGFSFDESYGFLEFSWEAKNISGKTIKYCHFTVIVYNAVGDKLGTRTFKVTGPIENNELISYLATGLNSEIWSALEGNNAAKVEISDITLEYMDGTKETGYYGYSTEEKLKRR